MRIEAISRLIFLIIFNTSIDQDGILFVEAEVTNELCSWTSYLWMHHWGQQLWRRYRRHNEDPPETNTTNNFFFEREKKIENGLFLHKRLSTTNIHRIRPRKRTILRHHGRSKNPKPWEKTKQVGPGSDLNGGVSATVEDLAGLDARDRHHFSLLSDSVVLEEGNGISLRLPLTLSEAYKDESGSNEKPVWR